MTAPLRVFEGAHLRAAHCPARGDQALITFDFRKTGRKGFGPAPKPGRLAALGWDHLHLSTARNDWFLNPDTQPMIRALAPVLAAFDRVHMLGYSMGAYGALRFAGPFGADRVTAVSPFLSLLPEVAPWEDRHAEDQIYWRQAGGLAEIPKTPGVVGHILVDPHVAADHAHARALCPVFPDMDLILLPGGGHPATKRQRETGQGAEVLALALGTGPGTTAKAQGRESH